MQTFNRNPSIGETRAWEAASPEAEKSPFAPQVQAVLDRRAFELVRLNLLQQLAVVLVDVEIQVPLGRPLARREEQGPAVDALVAEDPQQQAPGVLGGGEVNAHVLDVLEGLGGQDLRADVPARISISGLRVAARMASRH